MPARTIATGGDNRFINWTDHVKLALSGDAGATFGEPIVIDEGSPVGRPAALLGDGRIAVAWIERRGDVMLRFVDRDGKPGKPRIIATTSSGRVAGVLQTVRSEGRLVIAWRQDEQVRTTLVDAE